MLIVIPTFSLPFSFAVFRPSTAFKSTHFHRPAFCSFPTNVFKLPAQRVIQQSNIHSQINPCPKNLRQQQIYRYSHFASHLQQRHLDAHHFSPVHIIQHIVSIMGVYLTKPKVDKNSEDGGDDEILRYGLTSMQGWRRNMEDAHLAVTDINKNSQVAIYGVFDGHGGSAVAAWVKTHFAEEFQKNLTIIRNRLESGDLDINAQVSCHLEEAILKPPKVFRYPIGLHGLLDNCENAEEQPGESGVSYHVNAGDDVNVIEEEPESYIAPSELNAEALTVCEALQKTFLSLDERMKQRDSRDELKEIHDALKTDDEEESDVSSELQNLLQCYIDCGRSGGLVRVTDDGSGQKCLQIFNSDDYADDVDGHGDYPWAEEDEDESYLKRVEEITGEDMVGDGHVEGTVKDTVICDTEMVSPIGKQRSSNSDTSTGDDVTPFKSKVTKATDSTPQKSGGDSPEAEEEPPVVSRKAFKPKKRNMPTQEQDSPSEDAPTSEDAVAADTDESKGEDQVSRLLPYEPENCGATAVVTAIIRGLNPMLIAANAGDSRVVLCRGGVAIPMSKDHKPNNSREVRRIRAAGGRVIQGRVDGNLNLSRSVGDLAYKTDQNIPKEAQKITSFPDVRLIPIHRDDEFAVIACDGIWDCIKNQEIVDIVRERLRPQTENGQSASRQVLSEICEEICDKCLAANPMASEGIGCDNMTMMIVELGGQLRYHGVNKTVVPKLYRGRLYRLFENETPEGNDPEGIVSDSKQTIQAS